jgi:hypothetical protein
VGCARRVGGGEDGGVPKAVVDVGSGGIGHLGFLASGVRAGGGAQGT